jgi:hypothetical protein
MRALMFAVVVSACRAPQPTPAAPIEPVDAGTVVTESPAPDASTPGCPATFRAAETAHCVLGQEPSQCNYAEADCYCSPPPQCGGAYMHHPPGSQGYFTCNPKSASVLRGDGCPYQVPANGATCATEDKACLYGPCSWSTTTATCKSGAWVVTQYMGPPPP